MEKQTLPPLPKYIFRSAPPEEINRALLAYPPLLRHLLFSRGVETLEDADFFLNPDYEKHLHDPYLIKNMEKAVKRILSAIKKKQKIVLYSDYDHDGIPGGVVLHDFFKKIGYKNFENYIPHRHREGYGFNPDAARAFGEQKVDLIITVDCGIADCAAVDVANSFGIDVIITDHHLPPDPLPKAFAILNSKQADDSYPDDMLCGAAVAWKLTHALMQKALPEWGITSGWEKWLLDMVGLSTIADMVPLRKENRVLAHYGLKVLRKSPRHGVQQLLRKLKINQTTITEDDIGFMVAPRINAASRMGEPMDAFKMLVTSDPIEAGELAGHLEKLNSERKGLVASMAKEIKNNIKKRDSLDDVLVIGNPDWRPALLGLCANNIAEEYERPVFLWGREGNGIIKGSCRSHGGLNVIELMSSTKEGTFLQFGGHALSAGFSLEQEKVHTLPQALVEAYRKIGGEISGEPMLLDGVLSLDEVNQETYQMIERLSPFGIGNPKPLFLFENVMIAEVKLFGKEKNHLELTFRKNSGGKVSAIGFFVNDNSFPNALITQGERINLVASLEKSTFRGRPELRLRIEDIV